MSTRLPVLPAQPSSGLHAEVLRDDRDLLLLVDDWEDLYRRCPSATPFQTWAWVSSWWREYGESGKLRLVLVRQSGRLVALAPLMLRRRRATTILQPIGTGLSDWTDILLDPSAGACALDVLRDALLAEPRWQAIDLEEVAPGAAAQEMVAGWPGDRLRIAASVCQQLTVRPVDELVASLSRTNRANARRALRKIDEAGLESTTVVESEVPAAVERLLELHQRQWRDRGAVTPEHKRLRFARHVTGAVLQMVPRDQAALVEYRLQGRLVASSLLVVGPDTVGGYLYGAEPELYGRFNVTTMMMRTAMDVAVGQHCHVFSMMRGRESYKMDWAPETSHNDRLVLCRPGSFGGGVHLRSVGLQARAVDTVRTRAPRLGSFALRVRQAVQNPQRALATSSLARRRHLRGGDRP